MAEWYDAPVGTRVATEGGAAPAPLAGDEDLIAVVYPNGTAGTVRRADLQEAIVLHGARPEDEAATEARATKQRAEGHQLRAGLESFASTATFGGTDLLAGALSPEYAQQMREVRENNLAGTVVGGVAGAFTGAGSAASAAGRGAERAVAGRVGTGLGGRLTRAGVRTGVEGGVFGAGMGVSEVGLSRNWDPESAAATIGSNVLGGAALGAGIGVGGKLLEEGAIAARGMAQRQVENLRTPGAAAVDRSAFPEIAAMDKRAAREAIRAERESVRAARAAELVEGQAARDAEVAALEQAKDAAARDLFEEARAYKDYVRPKFITTGDRELARQLSKSKRSIMGGLDNDKAFVRARGSQRVLDGLEKQEKALTSVLDDADDVIANAGAERQALLDGLPTPKPPGAAPAVPGSVDDLPPGFRDFSYEAGDTYAAGRKINRGMPSWEKVSERGKDRLGRPVFDPVPEIYVASVDDFARAGLISDPTAVLKGGKITGLGEEMAKGAEGFAGQKMPPVDLIMLPDGRFIINDGNHRVRAALSRGEGRQIAAQVRPYTPGSHYGWENYPNRMDVLPPTGPAPQTGLYLTPEQSAMYRDFIGTSSPTAKPQTFAEFTKGKMGPAMREHGGHAGAMKALSAQYAEYKAGFAAANGGPAMVIDADDLRAFREAIERGDVHPPSVKRVMDAQEMLDANRALQAKFAAVKAPVTSETLAAIDKRIKDATAGLGKTPRLDALQAHLDDLTDERMGRKLSRAVGGIAGGGAGMGLGGPIGAAGGAMVGQEAGARLYDRLVRGITSGNAARAKTISTNVGRMFSATVEKTAAAAKKAAPLVSKILPAIRYAEKNYVDGVLGAANETPSRSKVVNEFRERARELNALTQKRPDGSFTVRMQAREALNARLAALWAIDADFANGVEKTHNARLEFLASKLPRNPAPPHLQVGPDTWEPSRAQIAKFARYMEAVEAPERVVQRLATATVTPEDVEVLRAVYPQMYEQVRGQVMDNMAAVRRRLPYEKRLALSIYLDVPVDPAVTPEAITVYQGLYAQEQAQQMGGSSTASQPRKAFTSSEKPTAGQRAAEG